MSKQNATHSLVGNLEDLKDFLVQVATLPSDESDLFMSIEGSCNDSPKKKAQGTISLLNIYTQTCHHTYMIDLHTLQSAAFATTVVIKSETDHNNDFTEGNEDSGFFDGIDDEMPISPKTEVSLTTILSSTKPTKIVYDVRTISTALYAHFGIKLQGVLDIQLLELAARPEGRRKFLMSFEKCVDIFGPLTGMKKVDMMEWKLERMQGRNLLAAYVRGDLGRGRRRNRSRAEQVNEVRGEVDDGGLWNERPLDTKLMKYSLARMKVLQGLRDLFLERLAGKADENGHSWIEKVERDTLARIEDSGPNTYMSARDRVNLGFGSNPKRSQP